MSWTAGKVKVLKLLWRSCWTEAAIGGALDMRLAAVTGKLHRLRQADDIDIILGDLTRKLMAREDISPFGVGDAITLLDMPGYRAGLNRALARGEVFSPPSPHPETSERKETPMHDKRGRELAVGDIVLVPMRITSATPGAETCNVGLTSIYGRQFDQLQDGFVTCTSVTLRANDGDENDFADIYASDAAENMPPVEPEGTQTAEGTDTGNEPVAGDAAA